ncbi:Adenosine deaminase-like protein [Phytophthora citrophthora]|uniref:Adenosine deaminase-like protein n=1 Tax=Phytophthora citrophthora TaxID=4793 RepID=A0AAD9H102_9STRA|nr:Adenosine deaminase-like protein [Phytophthora citrophthora]
MMDVLGPVDDKLAAYCRALPKVELHAHIHGSIRPLTLEELLQDEAALNGTEPLRLPKNRSLDECFEMFGLIHQVVVSRCVLRRIVIETVEDFAAENVKYLELRSTPRELPRDGASRADYVDEVVSALEECNARQDLDIQVRLLLSINRNQPVELAEDAVDMALKRKNEQHCPFIVGIDLSGNSERPDSEFCRFEHVLERARTGGLKLAVHFAEHFDDDESTRILNFRPDRLGHACCLPEPLYAKMLALRIPVEVCLTSNVHTLARYRNDGDCKCSSDEKHEASGLCVCGFTSHPHGKLLANARGQEQLGVYPMCICTDDYGVLETTLSTEYMRAAQAFALSEERLLEIAKAPIESIFDPSQTAKLKVLFQHGTQRQ